MDKPTSSEEAEGIAEAVDKVIDWVHDNRDRFGAGATPVLNALHRVRRETHDLID